MNKQATLEKITAWAKRRGFLYPSSDIYGGLANTWDWGPYGTELKNNIRDLWWKTFVQTREDVVGIDASIILNPKVWEASGHTKNFADVMVEDLVNKRRYRADHIIEDFLGTKKGESALFQMLERYSSLRDNKGGSFPIEFVRVSEALQKNKVDGLSPEELDTIIGELKIKSPDGNELSKAKRFNQLFKTEIGIIAGEKNEAYLRGEIAQGIFMNYKNILNSVRVKFPFGIAQYGKAFRNEITKGQLVHRTLEFDLMEFEYFIREENWQELYKYWEDQMWTFTQVLGLKKENLRWREHEEFERSHYSKMTKDIEYEYPFGWKEMFGLAYRTNFDLSNHMKNSGVDLTYRDTKTNEKFVPHVIEPTFGLSRLTGVLMFDAYTEEEINGSLRTVFKIAPQLAPVKVAIFPLQKDEGLRKLARGIFDELKGEFACEFDDSGNIGKMYRRQDEIGTPWCVTVDYDSLEDKSVTVRDRDTTKQERVKITELKDLFMKSLKSK